jgi:nucleotide-binding universal stress UspA family protein
MLGLGKLLLATDLTARSDRATDRAVLVSKQCGAELVAVHVMEPTARSPESAITNEERVRELLAYDLREAKSPAHFDVATGDPAERALELARAHGCGLIVTGVARADRLLGPTLGATVDKLVRTSDIPLLVVTERARDAYSNIVVAVDFSPASAAAVRTAAAWFPGARLTLFHAFDAPSILAATDPRRISEQFHDAAQASYAEFVRDLQLPSPPIPMLRRGDPGALLRELATSRSLDLVVMGTRRRGPVAEVLLGSIAKRILAHLACDALLVPA